jgi:hypothetical protein
MNTKIYLGVFLCFGCMSSSAIADEATAEQVITITVDKVMLISLDNSTTPTLSPTPPTKAGEKFGNWSVVNGFSGLLVSSNVDNAILKVKSDFDFSAENIALGISLINTSGGPSGSVSFGNTTEKTLATLGSIVTGTDRNASPLKINYSASEYNPNSNQIPSYGTYNATLTYTISEP